MLYTYAALGPSTWAASSGKPLIYFSLLFCTFSCFFEKSMKKYKKAQSSTFFRLFQGGQKSRPLFTSTQKVHVIKETLTNLKSILHRQFISRIVDSASLILHIKIRYEFVKFWKSTPKVWTSTWKVEDWAFPKLDFLLFLLEKSNKSTKKHKK